MKIHISFLFRIVTTVLLVFVTVGSLLNVFGTKLKSHYVSVASLQVNKVASLVSLNAVSSLINNEYSQVQFIYQDEDVLFDTSELNYLLRDSVNLIYDELKKVEKGTSSYFKSEYGNGIIYEIPFNLFSDNVILSSIGPKIPVKFSILGDIKGQFVSTIDEFGLNNALITINLQIDFTSKVFVPLSSNIIETAIEIPIYSRIFNGEIPGIYYGQIQGVDSIYSTEVQI